MNIVRKVMKLLRQLLFFAVASACIAAVIVYANQLDFAYQQETIASKPLPSSAAVSSTTPETGWTRESYLDPKLPHFGVSFKQNVSEVDEYQDLALHNVDTALIFKTWAKNKTFQNLDIINLHKRGIFPILSWEPWDSTQSPTSQPVYSLRSIIRGDHDDYLVAWAQAISDLDFMIGIRFAHEMNGHWYPWSESRNSNSAGEYVEAWKHIHNVFQDHNATNVLWIWSPNVNRYLQSVDIAGLYPGDDYVDLIGLSGYSVSDNDDFERVYRSTFSEIRTITEKKVLITELGVGGNSDTRPERIKSVLTGLGAEDGVIGYIWFQKSKRENWQIDYTAQTLAAYQESAGLFYKNWATSKGRSDSLLTDLELLGLTGFAK
jgi:hypothetical protein